MLILLFENTELKFFAICSFFYKNLNEICNILIYCVMISQSRLSN